MKKTCAIIASKIAQTTLNILKRGSCYPGALALKIDKNIMSKIVLPKTIIAVSGSSGKTTTSSMIASICKEAGLKVLHNNSGSNAINGICSLLLSNTTLNGTTSCDVLIMEIDERYIKEVFKYITPTYLVMTNLTKDQPPRHGHYDVVFEEVKAQIKTQTNLVLNADDPLSRSLGLDRKNVTYYGVNKNKLSYNKPISYNLEMLYCPLCSNKLKFNYFQFGNIGYYECTKCSFGRPQVDYLITNVELKENLATVNGKYKVKMYNDMIYSLYNIIAAFTMASILNIDNNTIISAFKKLSFNWERYKEYNLENRKIFLLSSKNENAPSYNQSLLYTNRKKEKMSVVFGFRKISWRYSHKDISWLWDIDFELLKNENIEKIICVGPFAYEMASRIRIAGIDSKKIICDKNYNNIMKLIKKNTKENVYAILNLDIADHFDEVFKGGTL